MGWRMTTKIKPLVGDHSLFYHQARLHGYSEFLLICRNQEDLLGDCYAIDSALESAQGVEPWWGSSAFNTRKFPVIFYKRYTPDSGIRINMAFKDPETKMTWILTHGVL